MAAASPLDRYRTAELTLTDLVDAASRLLRRLDVRPGDGRVAQEPDARGVRYYQTLGVVDKPVRYDGRRAIYGFRHLLQVVAVKRFQQEGHPLHLIQQSLAGCPTVVLEQALASVLSGLGGPPAPQPAVAAAPVPVSPAPAAEPPPPSRRVAPEPPQLIAARVAPGVSITVDPALVPDPDALIARVIAVLGPSKEEPPSEEH